jgi:hypothetical protein
MDMVLMLFLVLIHNLEKDEMVLDLELDHVVLVVKNH